MASPRLRRRARAPRSTEPCDAPQTDAPPMQHIAHRPRRARLRASLPSLPYALLCALLLWASAACGSNAPTDAAQEQPTEPAATSSSSLELPTLDDLPPPPPPEPVIDTSDYDAFLTEYQSTLRSRLMQRMGEQDLAARLQDRLTAAADASLLSPPPRRPHPPLAPAHVLHRPRLHAPPHQRATTSPPPPRSYSAILNDADSHAMRRDDYHADWLAAHRPRNRRRSPPKWRPTPA
jgi:hypothetical protein